MNNKKIFEIIYKFQLLSNSMSLEDNDLEYEDLKKDELAFLKDIEKNYDEIQNIISKNLTDNWDWKHLFPIDKSILIIAVYQICFQKDAKESQAINHALELAKKYSTENSTSFIHGVLSNIAK